MSETKGPDQILEANSYTSVDINGCVKLRIGDAEPDNYKPISVPSLLINAASKSPNHPALSVKRDDKWINWTYAEYLEDVRAVARAFIGLGLEERRSVAIMGFNSPEWFISDIAAVFCGGVAVGIYPTNTPEATQYIVEHCRANVIVVEDDNQLQKILKIKSQLPDLKAIVQYTGIPVGEGILSWKALMDLGQSNVHEKELKERLNNVAINQCCHLVYTSGTTGKPKGVMISHDNLTFTARVLGESYGLKFNEERIVSYLPLSHIAANILDMIVILSFRGTTFFADKNALKGTLNFTLKETLPTIFFGVPRVWEKFQEKMTEISQHSKGLKRQITNWAKRTGLRHNMNVLQGACGSDTVSFKLANQLVFQKVKVALGLNKCKIFAVAAAPFSPKTFEFFLSLDIRIMEIYGMSESSGPHTINTTEAQAMGTIGKSMKGCYTKIKGEDKCEGEILMKGRNVMMGYLNSEEKTAEAYDEDDWLRSGDVGILSEDGFYKITGRIKELLITAGGENVPPVPIEDAIKTTLPCVSNAIVIGDKRKFLSCLLTLKTDVDPETMQPLSNLAPVTLKWLTDHEVEGPPKTVDELLDGPEAQNFSKLIQKEIDSVNKGAVSNAQKIQKWVFLRKDLSIPGGELGPTLKVKRHIITKVHNDVIERFYK